MLLIGRLLRQAVRSGDGDAHLAADRPGPGGEDRSPAGLHRLEPLQPEEVLLSVYPEIPGDVDLDGPDVAVPQLHMGHVAGVAAEPDLAAAGSFGGGEDDGVGVAPSASLHVGCSAHQLLRRDGGEGAARAHVQDRGVNPCVASAVGAAPPGGVPGAGEILPEGLAAEPAVGVRAAGGGTAKPTILSRRVRRKGLALYGSGLFAAAEARPDALGGKILAVAPLAGVAEEEGIVERVPGHVRLPAGVGIGVGGGVRPPVGDPVPAGVPGGEGESAVLRLQLLGEGRQSGVCVEAALLIGFVEQAPAAGAGHQPPVPQPYQPDTVPGFIYRGNLAVRIPEGRRLLHGDAAGAPFPLQLFQGVGEAQILPVDFLHLPHSGIKGRLLFQIGHVALQPGEGYVLAREAEHRIPGPRRHVEVRVDHRAGAQIPVLVQHSLLLVGPEVGHHGGADSRLLRALAGGGRPRSQQK